MHRERREAECADRTTKKEDDYRDYANLVEERMAEKRPGDTKTAVVKDIARQKNVAQATVWNALAFRKGEAAAGGQIQRGVGVDVVVTLPKKFGLKAWVGEGHEERPSPEWKEMAG